MHIFWRTYACWEGSGSNLGSNGFGNCCVGGNHWDIYTCTCTYSGAPMHAGRAQEATWEAMDLVTVVLEVTTGTYTHAHAHILAHLCMLGGLRKQLGKQWIW